MSFHFSEHNNLEILKFVTSVYFTDKFSNIQFSYEWLVKTYSSKWLVKHAFLQFFLARSSRTSISWCIQSCPNTTPINAPKIDDILAIGGFAEHIEEHMKNTLKNSLWFSHRLSPCFMGAFWHRKPRGLTMFLPYAECTTFRTRSRYKQSSDT